MKQREWFFLFLGFTLGSIVGFVVGVIPSINPREQSHHSGHINPQSRKKAPDSPIDKWKKELEKNPDNYEVLLNLAKEYHQRENYKESKVFYQKALQISEKDAGVLCDFGMVLEELQQLPDAILQWEKAREIAPSDWQPLYYLTRAKILQKKNHQEIFQEYQNLKQKEPRSIEIPLGLGITYAQIDNFSQALVYFYEVLKIEPEHLQTLSYMARCYEKNNQPKEAAEFYEKILKQLPQGHRTEMILNKIEALKQSAKEK